MPLIEVAIVKEVAIEVRETMKNDEGAVGNVVFVDLNLFCLLAPDSSRPQATWAITCNQPNSF